MRYIVAQTEGVCSQAIELLVENDAILDAAFHGGCNGNLKGIVALVKGQKISDVRERLSGITCGGKSTSCPDQFAQLLTVL
ncbi:MAG: TIGR03905 family TSCPD domain-containing protein [Bacteroidales bacterium]|nr:TIGR03905 family TSCPD domain-containing protein [Bacteroidales bacterium]